MKVGPVAWTIGVALLLLMPACGGTSTGDYVRDIGPLADQYNSARDVVDEVIKAEANPPGTVQEGVQSARQWISRLESATTEIKSASIAFGNKDVPNKYQEHQRATLSAWRAGLEATTIFKLYLETFVTTGRVDHSLIITANRLFGEEDRFQLEARHALQRAR